MSILKKSIRMAVNSSILSVFLLSAPFAIANDKFEKFDTSKFKNSTVVDNKFMPLKPGTQFIYKGFTGDGAEKKNHTIIFTVTDLVKEINGIPCVVIWDRDIAEGKLEESELTYFAQDDDGNVWHLGQHREVYDETELVGGRTWIVGHLDGALAGIMMKAKPEVTGTDYSQGFAPSPFNWTDRAVTVKMGEKNEVPFGSFEDVLISEEYNDEEPNAKQLKYYAPDLGVIRIGWSGDDNNKEVMELMEVKNLTPEELKEASAEALKLETRAYVYGSTPPSKRITR